MKQFCVLNCENSKAWQPTSFADMFTLHLREPSDARWDVVHLAAGDPLPENVISMYDGFVITGSHFNCRDNLTWFGPLRELIVEVERVGRPFIYGGCFGHQICAEALGGSVDFNPGKRFVLKAESISISDSFRALVEATGMELSSAQESLKIIQSHGDCVASIGPKGKLLATSPSCQNEIILYGARNNILTCQCHPEFDFDYAIEERIWKSVVDLNKRLNESEIQLARDSFMNYEKYNDRWFLLNLLKQFLHQY